MKLGVKRNGHIDEIVESLEVAQTFWSRFRGLMLKSSLAIGRGMWITPCTSIHTCFMRFRIDAVFLNKRNEIVSLKPSIKPFRLVLAPLETTSVVELPAGEIERRNLCLGLECVIQ